MKKLILNNWPLKILSVAIAVILWLVVVNYDNPTKTVTISGIPIEIVNADVIEEQDMTYSLTGTATATIRVSARRKIADSLTVSDFRAVADFSSLYNMTSQIPVTVSCTNSKVSSDSITQVTQSLEVDLENLVEKKMAVQVSTTGTPTSGYIVGESVCSPSSVTIRAPESFMDQIGSVGVEVDVDDVTQDVQKISTLQYYSAGGSILDTSEVTELSASTTDINVTVPILNVKSVNITASVRGLKSVSDGYRYTGIEIEPDTVEIYGEKSAMANVTSLVLPESELDVSDAAGDIVKTLDLRDFLPEGVSLVDEENYEVTVTMKVEKLATKTFTLDLSSVAIQNLDPSLKVVSEDATMSVTVEGLEADLDSLTEEELSGTIDLDGLSAGSHSVTADIAVPSGFDIVGTVTLRLELSEAETDGDGG